MGDPSAPPKGIPSASNLTKAAERLAANCSTAFGNQKPARSSLYAFLIARSAGAGGRLCTSAVPPPSSDGAERDQSRTSQQHRTRLRKLSRVEAGVTEYDRAEQRRVRKRRRRVE